MTTISEIQARLDAIPAQMSPKGLRLPEASFWMDANAGPVAFLKWNTGAENRYQDQASEWFRGKSAAALLDQAEAYVANLPSAEETKRTIFLTALGKVIDLGNELGQDVGFLASEMKRLASNALTDQRQQPAE